MALSRIAQKFADEIRVQDWSDAHTRADGARHDRAVDRTSEPQMTKDETETVRLNIMWVVGQVLADEDPNFDVHEFAVAAGVTPEWLFRRDGKPSGGIRAGIRRNAPSPKELYREQLADDDLDSWGEGARRDFLRD